MYIIIVAAFDRYKIDQGVTTEGDVRRRKPGGIALMILSLKFNMKHLM